MKKRLYTSLLLLLGVVTGAYSQSKTISGGNDHGLIICAEGFLYTWGNNYSSTNAGPLLGIDETIPGYDDAIVYTPHKVRTGNLTFSMVTSGSGAFNLALSCHSVVYAWGDNSQSGCGQGANAGNVTQYPVPVLKGETSGYTEDGQPGGDYLGGVVYVAASTNSGFAIMDDGRVVGWGTGKWNSKTGAAASVPSYIKLKDGTDIKNVTHISGGDDNLLMRTSDGKLYGIGPWNGNGKNTVTYAAPVLNFDDDTPLTDIRMSAAADVAGYAVTGDGYVWSWGNGGWGGCTGMSTEGLTHYTAKKVCSGEYETISGEEYLTDVKEVIGGRGYGAAVTKEGYLVYWGCSDALVNGKVAPTGGGVVPTTNETITKYKNGSQGVKPILARYCDANGKPGELVKDAVSVSRGDIFGYMINEKDDYYTWGSNLYGECATGDASVEFYQCLTKLETIPCEIQDACPTVFMKDIRKCPGEEIELDCGYVIPTGKEDRYYIEWYKDGIKLNTSTLQKGANGYWTFDSSYLTDIYNSSSIKVSEAGKYKVIAYYIGTNIPCDACQPDSTEIEVSDMKMPVDMIVTDMNCVADPLTPSASDNICFEATVNGDFYNATQTAKFAAFSTETSTDTLEIMTAKGAGGAIKFCVTGDKIKSSEVHDNKSLPSNDTTYSVWLEDISSFDTYLYKNQTMAKTGSFGSYGLLIDSYSDADLKSFTISAKSYSGSTDIVVTPRVYSVVRNTNGIYVVGSVIWTGKAQTFTIDDAGPNDVVVECNVNLPGNPSRGIRYLIGMSMTGNCNMYMFEVGAHKEGNSPEFMTSISDSEKFGIYAIGSTANSYNSNSTSGDMLCYKNVLFGKLTDYDCGRIQLTARYGCPPCNQPDPFKIEVTGAAAKNDTIFLCEESDPVTLGVSSIKKATEPSAYFDELWFLDKVGADATALQVDEKKASSTLATSIEWTAAKEGTVEKYFIKVRDNEKKDAAACYVFDSVIVKYNTKPVAPKIDDIAFCENADASQKAALTNALASADFNGLSDTWYSDDKKSSKVGAPDLSTLTASDKYYYYDVTDNVTGCVSDIDSVKISVYEIPSDPLTAIDPFCYQSKVSLVAESPVELYKVTWYDESGSVVSDLSLSTLTGKDYTYQYTLTSAAPENCVSDKVAFPFTVKNYAEIELDSTMTCGKTVVTTKSSTPSDATITWKLSDAVISDPTFTAVSGQVGNVGELKAYVTKTGYCDTVSSPMDIYVKEVPSKPDGDKKVTYLKTDATNKVFKNLLEQNPKVITEETGYTLQWYDASGNKLSGCPVPPYPADNETEDKTYTYKVSRINADGCESELETVTVIVYLTPAPTTSDVSYCLNSDNIRALEAIINDPNNSGDFRLQWYDENNNKQDYIIPDVTKPGKTTYHVTQISSDGAESSPADLVVTVLEVLEPTLSTSNVYEYCAENSTVTLGASLNSDGDLHPASALVWSEKDETTGNYEVITTPNFSLDVTETTIHHFAVHQTYSISEDQVCVGPLIEKEVKVTYVPKVVTHEVLYLKAAANADGTFSKNLLEQNPSAVEYLSSASLIWYESDCHTEITTGAPSPVIDPSVPTGSEQNESYCVSQKLDGCVSIPTPISVRISDALPPTPYEYHYCEGAVMEDLKADINKLTASSEYELYWYGTNEPASTSASDDVVKGNTYPMNGQVATVDDPNSVKTLTYWVAQHDKSTDAVSAAQPVVIKIYPQPIVDITTPSPTCETNVNLALNGKVSNVSYNTITYNYYKDNTLMVGSSDARETGKYQISAQYTLPATESSTVIVSENGVCAGPKSDVDVVINDLSVPDIIGVYSTCPGTSVTLHAQAESNDPGNNMITYSWTADPSSAIDRTAGDSLVTTNLSTVPDTKYSFSVTATAGACTKKIVDGNDHVVVIGNGQVIGAMIVQEDENYEGDPFTFKDDSERFFVSCGNSVNMTVNYNTTGDGTYTWYKNGNLWKTGASVQTDPITEDAEDVYRVEFINQCKAVAEITVQTVTLSATPVSQDLVELCEKSTFQTSFDYKLQPGLNPIITWYHDGVKMGGQSSNVMTLYNTTDEDDGLYSFMIQNNGCVVKNDANTLNVKPLVRASIQSVPFIVDRHETATLPVSFNVPSSGTQNIEWMENGVKVGNQNPLKVSDVTADHYYDIYLTDPEYCGDTLHATLYVDAELQLKTEMKDVICLGNEAVLKIDTTGTGAFRNLNGNPMLNVYYYKNNVTYNLFDKIEKVGDTLEVRVSPEEDTEYYVSFTYTSQSKKQELSAIENLEVIPAISLHTPAVPNVCEGTETSLEVLNVQPEGTTVSWKADETILNGENTTKVVVRPTYLGGPSHQALYTYTAVAYNDFCQTSKEYDVQVLVDEPLKGDITGVSEVCEGFEATFDASSYDATTYTWYPDTIGLTASPVQIVKPTESTQYTVDMVRGLCSASDTFVVIVHSNPVIESIDSIALRDRQIVLVQDRGEAPFLYGIDVQPADENNIKTNLTFSKHIVNVTDRYGCKTTGSFRLDPPAIVIPELVSDNGDGINDVWLIPNLADVYPNAIVTIYDRFGKQLAQFLGADSEGWDCTYMGKKLPSTDYWYQITIEEINREYTGHFTLIRR